jgi:hypothetical protein
MRICSLIDRSRVLRWHIWLADALSGQRDREVFLASAQVTIPLPRTFELVREIERLVYGLHQETAMDRVDDQSLARHQLADADEHLKFDVIVDLVGHEQTPVAYQRTLTPLFNSVPGDAGALLAVLDSGPLRIELSDNAEWFEPLAAQPAISDRRVLTKAVDNVLSCAIELILKAIDAPARLAPVLNPGQGVPVGRGGHLAPRP